MLRALATISLSQYTWWVSRLYEGENCFADRVSTSNCVLILPETGYFDLQEEDFITESVLRLIRGSDEPDGGRHDSNGIERSASAGDRGSGENCPNSGACNPLVWQASNAGLVDKKVLRRIVHHHRPRFPHYRYRGQLFKLNRFVFCTCFHSFHILGRIDLHPWGQRCQ